MRISFSLFYGYLKRFFREWHFSWQLVVLATLFVAMRLATIEAYKDTYYFFGMVSNQFAIAESYYNGHGFAKNKTLIRDVRAATYKYDASSSRGFIPLEEWVDFESEPEDYQTFPAQDLPGYGYIIATTSHWFDTRLTSKYAFTLQVFAELLAVLLFVFCVSLIFGKRIALVGGLLYVFAYPFVWAAASQPMRDIFVMTIYSFLISSMMAFIMAKKRWVVFLGVFLLAVGSLTLWVRPPAFYMFFLFSPLIFFAKDVSRTRKTLYVILGFVIPLVIFQFPYRAFNIRHYNVSDTGYIGASIWEGMGIIEDNPYGFVRSDTAVVPWVRSQGFDYSYLSPEMNKVLSDYAIDVIKKDPVYYLRVVLARCQMILSEPLTMTSPGKETPAISEMPLATYIIEHPTEFFFKVLNNLQYRRVFFHLGWILFVVMWFKLRNQRLMLVLFLAPFLYTLMTILPVRFESRYMAMGAWTLILPLAWGISTAGDFLKQFWTRTVHPNVLKWRKKRES